ncbi:MULTISPECIES: lytic transglycosylase domain-containing protein [unclassified Corynebacterium]|uniref:lytic transglycosylase domain-containing protein n=1 Tax=unclassified Corynebacterium TaxID=2624378 RepID=UPI0029C9E281|nr:MULTISPECIES: lytic murein transglycosylase [unclassified Corynebacterium]WPF66871.1 lytic murein transglycosylase [Corynebacterium sp. 22KM0430]WPF69359.1 lytic murein transglycosylase [Corynebacterium sp. 21KM1197]
MANEGRRAAGCGCSVILAVILIIALVAWAFSVFGGSEGARTLQPVPDTTPPSAGAEVPVIDVHAPGRTSDKLGFWAKPLAEQTGIPESALRAYGNAELIATEAWPQCHLRWTTLAGLGYVETRHGTYSGKWFNHSSIGEDGVVDPPIVGIALDGSPGVAEIPDTDAGRLDGDTEYDRAVGPMQFIPESWGRFGLDASGDGKADPQQIDDAALSAAKLLCHGRDLSQADQWVDAIHAYNMSQDYLIKVRNAANSYALGQPAP